jgi:uncharacterized protein (DUF2062 family)
MVRFPRARAWLEQLLHTHDTPTRTAGAYALGVFFGFSPVLGLHTILGLFFAFALNLNRVAVLLGVYSNLPWFLVPYYTLATWMGAAILGVDIPHGTIEHLVASLENRSWAEFRAAAVNLRPFLWAFALGSTLGSCVLSLVAYRAAFAMISTHHNRLHRLQDPEL